MNRRSWLRRTVLAAAGLALTASAFPTTPSGAQEVTLVAAGDIEWSRAVKPPHSYRSIVQRQEGDWIAVPYLNLAEHRTEVQRRVGRELDGPDAHYLRSIQYGLEFRSLEEEVRHPFQRTRDVLTAADVAFANLEMPLSERGRHSGAFRGPTAFADALRWTGIDVVSIANNHAWDAEEVGLLDTMGALRKAGVGYVGGGVSLEDARRPHIVDRNGIRMAFLGYTWNVNILSGAAFARPDQAGVMPLDPILIKQDIQRVRDQVDYVILSFHWSLENEKETHPDDRAFAYEMIDAGADIILGHHPHVARGFEVYRGKPIFYSLGNFIFGHNHDYWGDGYFARLTLGKDRVTQVEILPLAGQGMDMAQPYLLEGQRAAALLEEVRDLSAKLDTRLEIQGNKGVVRP